MKKENRKIALGIALVAVGVMFGWFCFGTIGLIFGGIIGGILWAKW